MKQNKYQNKFDLMMDHLAGEFGKISNLDILITDPDAKRAFNLVSFRLSEIISYKELIGNHFIPATNKAIADNKNDILHSRYKHLLDIKSMDFLESLHDTLRLAYVGLFHKIESFVGSLEEIGNVLFSEDGTYKRNVLQWTKENYNFDFRDWSKFSVIHKIYWICICVKHYDGFPLKKPVPFSITIKDPDSRIKLSVKEFKEDCDMLLKIYNIFISLFLSLTLSKKMMDDIDKEFLEGNPELFEIQEEAKYKLDKVIRDNLAKFC